MKKDPEYHPGEKTEATHTPDKSEPCPGPRNSIINMHRNLGNQAVSRLLAGGEIQAKLEVGESGDPLEREADESTDEISDQVMNQMAGCDTTPPPLENSTPVIQTWANGSSISEITPKLKNKLNTHKGDCHMQASTLCEMEKAFSADFSEVIIHKDQGAAEISRQLNARAFTLGNEIFFSAQSYRPNTFEGKKLLGHELAHVIQQRAGRVQPGAQSKGFTVNNDDQLEREADEQGQRIAMGKEVVAPPYKSNSVNESLSKQDSIQGKAVIQCWGELNDTPLISAYFRGDARFAAVLEDPPQIIQRGQEGPHVSKLQEALLELQYNLPDEGVDGNFGPETEDAVRNFQIEAGAPEEAQDGKVGPDTLRELDQRFATVSRSRMTAVAPAGAVSEGSFFVFQVPVTQIMAEEEFLIASLQHVLPISEIEAQILAREGWGFRDFSPITDATVGSGFRAVRVPVSDHRSVVSASRRRFSSERTQEEEDRFLESVEGSVFNLTGTDNIYSLNQEIEAKRQELSLIRMTSIRDSGIDYTQKQRNIARAEAELAALISRRDAALERLGITQEIYEQQQQTFKDNFALFAIRVAGRMLRENEASANVEATRYGNLHRVAEVKAIFTELNALYQRANSEKAAGSAHELNEFDQSVRLYPQVREAIDHNFRTNFQWPNRRRGGNAHWEAYWDLEQEAFERLQDAAQVYPILAHPGLEIRNNAHRYSAMELPDLQSVLQSQITDVNQNIEQIRGSLNTQNIWELEAVIARAKYELGILDGSIQATIVADGVAQARSSRTVRNLLLAAAGIGFGLLALASGPVGWAALGASIAIGSIDAYLTYQDVSFTRAARRTAVDPANSLTSLDASWVWFGLSLVCIGIDVAAAVKIARGIGAAARATRTAADLQQEAIRVIDSAAEVTEEVAEGIIQIANRAEVRQILESQRAYDALRMVAAIEDNAAAARLASAMSENAELLPALLRVEQVSTQAVQFYAGTGHRFLNDLPDVLRVADSGNLVSNPQLYEMLLTEPRMQRVLLDNADNPRLLLDDWATWQRARTRPRNPVNSNFPEYLHLGLGRRTSLGRTTTLLTDIFGASFNSLDNLAKNRHILRQTAGNLVDAFNSGSLPRQLQDALTEVMNRDLIRSATDLESARERVIRAVNDVIGENVDDMASYRQVMEVLEQSGSRGALGEAFARVMDLIPGFRSGRRLTIDFGDVGIDALNGRRVIIDRYVADGSIIGEIKVGSSFDRAQMLRYKAMYENPDLLAEYFRAARVEGGSFDEIIYLVMPGPSTLSRSTRDYALTIYRALVREEMNLYSMVHFLDGDGVLWRVVAENSFEQVSRIN